MVVADVLTFCRDVTTMLDGAKSEARNMTAFDSTVITLLCQDIGAKVTELAGRMPHDPTDVEREAFLLRVSAGESSNELQDKYEEACSDVRHAKKQLQGEEDKVFDLVRKLNLRDAVVDNLRKHTIREAAHAQQGLKANYAAVPFELLDALDCELNTVVLEKEKALAEQREALNNSLQRRERHLRNIIDAKEREIIQLQLQHRNALAHLHGSHTSSIEKLTTENDKLRQQMAEAQQHAMQVAEARFAVKLEEGLSEMRRATNEKLAAMQMQVSAAEAAKAAEAARCQELEEENASYVRRILLLQRELSHTLNVELPFTVNRATEAAEARLREAQAELEALTAQRDDDARVAAQQQSILNATIQQLKEEIAKLEKEVSSSRHDSSAKDNTIRETNAQKIQLQQQLSMLRRELAEVQSEMEALRRSSESGGASTEDLNRKLLQLKGEYGEKVAALEADVKVLQKERDTSEGLLLATRTKLDGAMETVKHLEQANDTLQKSLSGAEAKLAEANKKADGLLSACSLLKSTAKENAEKIDALSRELDQLKLERGGSSDELARVKSELDEARGEKQKLLLELQQLQQQQQQEKGTGKKSEGASAAAAPNVATQSLPSGAFLTEGKDDAAATAAQQQQHHPGKKDGKKLSSSASSGSFAPTAKRRSSGHQLTLTTASSQQQDQQQQQQQPQQQAAKQPKPPPPPKIEVAQIGVQCDLLLPSALPQKEVEVAEEKKEEEEQPKQQEQPTQQLPQDATNALHDPSKVASRETRRQNAKLRMELAVLRMKDEFMWRQHRELLPPVEWEADQVPVMAWKRDDGGDDGIGGDDDDGDADGVEHTRDQQQEDAKEAPPLLLEFLPVPTTLFAINVERQNATLEDELQRRRKLHSGRKDALEQLLQRQREAEAAAILGKAATAAPPPPPSSLDALKHMVTSHSKRSEEEEEDAEELQQHDEDSNFVFRAKTATPRPPQSARAPQHFSMLRSTLNDDAFRQYYFYTPPHVADTTLVAEGHRAVGTAASSGGGRPASAMGTAAAAAGSTKVVLAYNNMLPVHDLQLDRARSGNQRRPTSARTPMGAGFRGTRRTHWDEGDDQQQSPRSRRSNRVVTHEQQQKQQQREQQQQAATSTKHVPTRQVIDPMQYYMTQNMKSAKEFTAKRETIGGKLSGKAVRYSAKRPVPAADDDEIREEADDVQDAAESSNANIAVSALSPRGNQEAMQRPPRRDINEIVREHTHPL